MQGPVGTTDELGERGPEGHYGTQGLVGDKAIVVNEVIVVRKEKRAFEVTIQMF